MITFVKEHEGISFFEAVKLVASKYNITVPERELTDDERKKAKEREALQICLTFAQETFTAFLKKKEAAEYLETRGITPNILSKYGAGYSSSMFTALTELGSQKGYDMATMEKTGLIIRKENGKIFDRFVNRITFPFYSLSGLVIGFTGRSLEKDTQCKYLNSPETPLFIRERRYSVYTKLVKRYRNPINAIWWKVNLMYSLSFNPVIPIRSAVAVPPLH